MIIFSSDSDGQRRWVESRQSFQRLAGAYPTSLQINVSTYRRNLRSGLCSCDLPERYSMSGRGSDDDLAQPDTWHEFPDVPTFSEEGFRLSGNVLEGFEDLMELTPNAPAASFAAHGFGQSASAPSPSPVAEASGSPDTAAAPTAPRPTDERRQFRNRMSQRRFRERQKASHRTSATASCKIVCSIC